MINWSRVNELRSEVGAEDFQDVVHLFLEEVDDALLRLGSNESPDATAADLHFLRGSAVSLGFSVFSDLCEKAEVRSVVSSADISEILEIYEKSKAEFLAGLPDQVAA
ncbi:MAG: Hpt domain-containing protein [Marinibacterium sp.]